MSQSHFRAGASLASVAAVIALAPEYAHAQAFQGTPTLTYGSATFDRISPGTETITVDSVRATVNWVPSDTGIGGGPINFLPGGAGPLPPFVANYVAGSGLGGAPFTILNRILPTDATRSIQFNGTVNSPAGGSVWFYTPGGIILGSSARFNVGSLLLTTGDLVVDANNDFMPVAGQFGVNNAAGSLAPIQLAEALIPALWWGILVWVFKPKYGSIIFVSHQNPPSAFSLTYSRTMSGFGIRACRVTPHG
jgi:filamentous hemagglutinin family protein